MEEGNLSKPRNKLPNFNQIFTRQYGHPDQERKLPGKPGTGVRVIKKFAERAVKTRTERVSAG